MNYDKLLRIVLMAHDGIHSDLTDEAVVFNIALENGHEAIIHLQDNGRYNAFITDADGNVTEQDMEEHSNSREDGIIVMPADWFVIVKIKRTNHEVSGQTELEQYAQDAADSLHPTECFESTHLVFDNGFGSYVRPDWATDHKVK